MNRGINLTKNDVETCVVQALKGAEGESDVVKASVAAAALNAAAVVPPPSRPEDVGFIWKVVVIGLLAILAVVAGGVIYAVVAGKGTEVLVGIFTTVLSGFLALFIKPPAKQPEPEAG
ncbi:hypothetical protein [Streptomyces flavidovirens]